MGAEKAMRRMRANVRKDRPLQSVRIRSDHEGTHIVCKCECGGNVRGVHDFGQLWTYCDKCTPSTKVRWNESGTGIEFIK